MYIAVDFDGTCVAPAFPEVGKEIGAACVLKYLVHSGNKILLNTMRSNNKDRAYLDDAVNWFKDHGIKLYGINENPDQHFSTSPKVHADLYIDDLSLGIPTMHDKDGDYVNWMECVDLLADKDLIDEHDIVSLKFQVAITNVQIDKK